MAIEATNKRKFDKLLTKSRRISRRVAELSKDVGTINVPEFLHQIPEKELPNEIWLKEIVSCPLISEEEKELARRILSIINIRRHGSQK